MSAVSCRYHIRPRCFSPSLLNDREPQGFFVLHHLLSYHLNTTTAQTSRHNVRLLGDLNRKWSQWNVAEKPHTVYGGEMATERLNLTYIADR